MENKSQQEIHKTHFDRGSFSTRTPPQQPTYQFSQQQQTYELPNRAENAYNVRKSANSKNNSQKIISAIMGYLNKISENNINKILEKVILLIFDKNFLEDEKAVEKIFGILFDKAIYEKSYTQLYVSFFKNIIYNPREKDDGPKYTKLFRRLLINKCQISFKERNQPFQSEDNEEEHNDMKSKEKSKGVITLISNLYLADVLNSTIIMYITDILLKEGKQREEKYLNEIELLMETITLCGKKIIEEKSFEVKLNKILKDLGELMKLEGDTNRIRLLSINLFELVDRNWEVKKKMNISRSFSSKKSFENMD